MKGATKYPSKAAARSLGSGMRAIFPEARGVPTCKYLGLGWCAKDSDDSDVIAIIEEIMENLSSQDLLQAGGRTSIDKWEHLAMRPSYNPNLNV